MQYREFEFASEEELRETVRKLWDELGISGEMAIKPLSGGRWRLELAAEKELRDAVLEKFAGFLVASGD